MAASSSAHGAAAVLKDMDVLKSETGKDARACEACAGFGSGFRRGAGRWTAGAAERGRAAGR